MTRSSAATAWKACDRLPDDCIDLTVTSPPYGKMRDYGGQDFTHEKFQSIARELYRITKPGGIVVWVVRDQILRRKGATGESARQWLYFQEVGFHLHDKIPMERLGQRWSGRNRYGNSIEYAFVVSKGRPDFVDLIRDRENKHAGTVDVFTRRAENGEQQVAGKPQAIHRMGVRGGVWTYKAGGRSTTKDHDALAHPPGAHARADGRQITSSPGPAPANSSSTQWRVAEPPARWHC